MYIQFKIFFMIVQILMLFLIIGVVANMKVQPEALPSSRRSEN